MNKRNLALACGLVLVMGVVAVWLDRRQGPSGDQNQRPLLFPALAGQLENVQRLQLRGGDGEVNVLRRDGRWVVGERDGYPADFKVLSSLLSELAEVHRVEAKTAKPENHAALGLEALDAGGEGPLLALYTAQEQPEFEVLLGTQADGRGGRYLRQPADPQTWLVDKPLNVPSSAADWLDRSLLDVDYAEVSSFERVLADGQSFVAQRAGGPDSDFVTDALPEGRELRYASALNGAVRALLGLRFEDVRASAGEPGQSMVQTRVNADGLIVVARVWQEGEHHWLRLVAEASPADVTTDGSEPTATADWQATAEAINARSAGWDYRISSYSYGELSKPLEDYLAEPANKE